MIAFFFSSSALWTALGFLMAKGKASSAKAAVKAKAAPIKSSTSMLPFLLSLPVILSIMLEGGGIIPVTKVFRNIFFPGKPGDLVAAYPTCSDKMMAEDMTIIVSVKDACSQAPGFIDGLAKFAPPSVHLIYSFPNFTSCATIDLDKQLSRWDKVTMLPLSLRSSPMRGWLDAVPYIKTEYSLLMHNDG